jgi:Tol biopolymer transport system component
MNRASHWTLTTGFATLAALVASAQTTERLSVSSGGTQGDSISTVPAITADGGFVAFQSRATNLAFGDTNDSQDIFVRDLQNGTTARVSVATGGAQGDGNSSFPSISADGRFVAFQSLATNLVVGDTNGISDVFVHDRLTGSTARVSVGPAGAQSDFNSQNASISADGRYVAFESDATNLVAGDTNFVQDVFVHDRLNGTTERVSVDAAGMEATQNSFSPSISSDGRYVSFTSAATTLVAGDTNGFWDIFVRDRVGATIERVSLSTAGAQGNFLSFESAISGDGRFVAFGSLASNLVAGDANGAADVFVRDRLNASTERVSIDSGGLPGNMNSNMPAISPDGRFVAFGSSATNLVAGDTNGRDDVFLRDRTSGTTERISLATGGAQADANSQAPPAVSHDGRFVAFGSLATNLVAGDTNGVDDVFLRDRAGIAPPSPFCFGDGTGTLCTCGSGAPGNGCPSSLNPSGANLAASGSASLAADTLLLLGSGMPNSFALYFQGTTQVAGGAGANFGDGLRCAGGAIVRLGTKSNSSGASQYPDTSDPPVSVRGQVTMPGLRTYQIWYRNAADFCTPDTFNLTNGLAVTWTP